MLLLSVAELKLFPHLPPLSPETFREVLGDCFDKFTLDALLSEILFNLSGGGCCVP